MYKTKLIISSILRPKKLKRADSKIDLALKLGINSPNVEIMAKRAPKMKARL